MGNWGTAGANGHRSPDTLIPVASEVPGPAPRVDVNGEPRCLRIAPLRDTPLVSPSRDGGDSPTATRGRLPDFAQRSPPSLLVFFAWSVCRRDFPRTGSCKALCSLPWLTRFPALITAMSAALKSSHLLPSRSWPCLALLIDPGTFPPEFDLCPRWWRAGKSLSINLDRLCRTNYCSANDRDNPLLIWRVIHFTPVRIFKALISESLLGNY